MYRHTHVPFTRFYSFLLLFFHLCRLVVSTKQDGAVVARQAHNLKCRGSIPLPAPKHFISFFMVLEEQLMNFALDSKEVDLLLEKYPAEVLERAIKRTPFKTRSCFRQSLYLTLKLEGYTKKRLADQKKICLPEDQESPSSS